MLKRAGEEREKELAESVLLQVPQHLVQTTVYVVAPIKNEVVGTSKTKTYPDKSDFLLADAAAILVDKYSRMSAIDPHSFLFIKTTYQCKQTRSLEGQLNQQLSVHAQFDSVQNEYKIEIRFGVEAVHWKTFSDLEVQMMANEINKRSD